MFDRALGKLAVRYAGSDSRLARRWIIFQGLSDLVLLGITVLLFFPLLLLLFGIMLDHFESNYIPAVMVVLFALILLQMKAVSTKSELDQANGDSEGSAFKK